jgi:hypothetical protein
MKWLFITLSILMTFGCASLSYTAPDGTKVTYTRFFTTADNIKGTLNPASIEANGQKIDTQLLQQMLGVLLQGAK